MINENDADVDRALAALGGTTMKYLNFASPLLKRTARTSSLASSSSSAAGPSYEPLFKRAPIATPEIAPLLPECDPPPAPTEPAVSVTNDAVVGILDEPEAELSPCSAGASTDEDDGVVVPEPPPVRATEPEYLADAAAPLAPHAHESVAAAPPAPPAPPPPLPHESSEASEPSTPADLVPFTSLADHMVRVFGNLPERQPADSLLRANAATDQAAASTPDRRTIAEMFRILSGRSESPGHAIDAAQWQDTERSLFRRI